MLLLTNISEYGPENVPSALGPPLTQKLRDQV